MGAVRMNITLPQKTANLLRKSAKPRERSAIIAEALELYFKRKSERDFVQELIRDYKAANELNEEDQEWLDSSLGDTDEN